MRGGDGGGTRLRRASLPAEAAPAAHAHAGHASARFRRPPPVRDSPTERSLPCEPRVQLLPSSRPLPPERPSASSPHARPLNPRSCLSRCVLPDKSARQPGQLTWAVRYPCMRRAARGTRRGPYPKMAIGGGTTEHGRDGARCCSLPCEFGHFRPGQSLRARCPVPYMISFSPSYVLHSRHDSHAMMGPPPLVSARQPRLSCSSTATHTGSQTGSLTGSSDSRNFKGAHRKENQFVYRNGSKLHAYDRDKAPYPSSFDRQFVDLYVLPSYSLFLGYPCERHSAQPMPRQCPYAILKRQHLFPRI